MGRSTIGWQFLREYLMTALRRIGNMPPAMTSSATCEWPTPEAFFAGVEAEFGPFDLDACASKDNKKVAHFTDTENWISGLAVPWEGKVWMNPPYGRSIGQWIKKAYESALGGATVVCLIPARTDTAYWHDYVLKASEIRFIRGRLKFVGAKNSAPFPSALVVFNGTAPAASAGQV